MIMSGLRAYEQVLQEFMNAYWEYYPNKASRNGLHQYDGMLKVKTKKDIREWTHLMRELLTRLEAINPTELPPRKRIDFEYLQMILQKEIFYHEELEPHKTMPQLYIWDLNCFHYISRDYAPAEDRAKAIIKYLENGVKLLEHAKTMLDSKLSKIYIEITIESIGFQKKFFQDDLPRAFEGKISAETMSMLKSSINNILKAMDDFKQFLEGQLPRAKDDFAIGRDKYLRLLRISEGLNITDEELLAIAEKDLQRNKRRLQELAELHYAGKTPKEVIEEIKQKHPQKEKLISTTEQMLESIRQWVIDHDIITIPSEQRCKVIETPSFMRAFAFAAMDTPGPFEKKATDSYYYVSPPEDNWPEEKQVEWLKLFALPILELISIHEAYPGHFIHFLHLRESDSMTNIWWNYHFTEGWAHYTEELFIELGYKKDDPEIEIAQILEALVRNVRFICSVRLHTDPNFTLDDATKRFIEDAYLEPKTAYVEARRGTFDFLYLGYTIGKLMIMKLREDYKKEKGPQFSLKEFHDKMMSYGAPPVPLLRKYMLTHDDGSVFPE